MWIKLSFFLNLGGNMRFWWCFGVFSLVRWFFIFAKVFQKSVHSFQCPWNFNGLSKNYRKFSKVSKISRNFRKMLSSHCYCYFRDIRYTDFSARFQTNNWQIILRNIVRSIQETKSAGNSEKRFSNCLTGWKFPLILEEVLQDRLARACQNLPRHLPRQLTRFFQDLTRLAKFRVE